MAEQALEAALAGLAAVDANTLVKAAVRQGLLDDWFENREHPKRIHVLALGKAAPRMLWGLVEVSVPLVGLGVAPAGMQVPHIDTFQWLAGDHPIPNDRSFAAGERILSWVATLPPGAPVLVLLSGGASALAEVPRSTSRAQLRDLWRTWMSAGLPIAELNQRRATLSALKAGQLGRALLEKTSRIRVWLLADTNPDDAAAVVGSAPFYQAAQPELIPHRVLATTQTMVAAAGVRLGLAGHSVFAHGRRITHEAEAEVADFVGAYAKLPPGSALVGGGEPVVRLPAAAPPGGRSHHAALLAARELSRLGIPGLFMALASDGVDGGSGSSGAWATVEDWDDKAEKALAGFDAARLLRERKRSIDVGATGTNVNDLWVLVPFP